MYHFLITFFRLHRGTKHLSVNKGTRLKRQNYAALSVKAKVSETVFRGKYSVLFILFGK